MTDATPCPNCGRESPAIDGPRIGSERARSFQYARLGARHRACPEHGRFSIRPEKLDGTESLIAVIDNEPGDSYYVIGT